MVVFFREESSWDQYYHLHLLLIVGALLASAALQITINNIRKKTGTKFVSQIIMLYRDEDEQKKHTYDLVNPFLLGCTFNSPFRLDPFDMLDTYPISAVV